MTLFPELRYRGLLSDVPMLPGLLGPQAPPQQQQAPPAPPPPTPQPQGNGGGIGHVLGSIFGGQDDPRLTPEQNAAAKHQALIQAGLAILASPDSGIAAIAQGGMAGQQAGQQQREMVYGRTQQERVANALKDPAIMALVPEGARAILPYLDPGAAIKIISEAAMKGDETTVVAPNASVFKDGKEVYRNTDPNELDHQDVGDKIVYFKKGHPDQVAYSLPKGSAPQTAGERSQQTVSNSNALASQFFTQTTTDRSIADAYLNAKDAQKRNDAVSDQTLIVAFNKMIDPNSIVREGEFDRVANSGGFTAAAQSFANKFLDHGRLPADVRAQLVAQVEGLAQAHASAFRPMLDQYRARAAEGGVNADNVIFDPYTRAGLSSPAWGTKP